MIVTLAVAQDSRVSFCCWPGADQTELGENVADVLAHGAGNGERLLSDSGLFVVALGHQREDFLLARSRHGRGIAGGVE